MHQHSTVLRAASPTVEEGRVFARYLDTAAEGFFRFMLGRRSMDIIAAAFLKPDHDLSFQNATFAERDKVIVGMVSGYTAAQHRRSSGRPLEQAVASGSGRLVLDVSAKNDGARQLYEHRGMTVTSQWPKRLPIPGLKLFRMTKELTTDSL